jgi:hypothetical protein
MSWKVTSQQVEKEQNRRTNSQPIKTTGYKKELRSEDTATEEEEKTWRIICGELFAGSVSYWAHRIVLNLKDFLKT